MIRMGDTWVLCSAAVDESVPPFLVGRGQGWVTSEYAMIPPSSPQRIPWNRGTGGGRQQEISRLIGRGLRAAIDLKKLGERQITLDCTVIQADGGTRTAGVTGAYVALALAIHDLLASGKLQGSPLLTPVAAVSVGLVKGDALLDLAYVEDSVADADVNVIQTIGGDLVEVQGTAEGVAFPREKLDRLLDLAGQGNMQLFTEQRLALAQVLSAEALSALHPDTPRLAASAPNG
jgi:ribonuclease PH